MKFAKNFNNRIAGGSNAWTPIPWQVMVRTSKKRLFCGGTILDEFTILSAASCEITSRNYIVAGAKSLKSGLPAGRRTQTRRVKNVINHPNATFRYDPHDYSILKLRKPLNFNSPFNNVKPACLPTANHVVPGDRFGDFAFASGWGHQPTDCKFDFDFNI